MTMMNTNRLGLFQNELWCVLTDNIFQGRSKFSLRRDFPHLQKVRVVHHLILLVATQPK
jgi:hypothetical protein